MFDHDLAFSRNLGTVSKTEMALLKNKKVAIPGCGGVGSIYAMAAARAGISRFAIADFDTFEIENFNRQFGAKISTIGMLKIDVVKREILDINSDAEVEVFPKGICLDNISSFLSGVDVVLDSLDYFAFKERFELYNAAQVAKIPVICAAPLGFSSALLVFLPEGMPFGKYFDFSSEDSDVDRALKFAIGLAPKGTHIRYLDPAYINLEEKRGPSHVVGVTLCASFAIGTLVKILLKRGRIKPVPHFSQVDAYRGVLKKGYLFFGNRNPWQRLKLWWIKNVFLKMKN